MATTSPATAIDGAEFAAWLDRLGPFEPDPCLAVGVSGGPDSSALALLTRDFLARRGGTLIGLIVDHGLRENSAAEAALTATRLADQAIPSRILTLHGLSAGSGLAARARAARLHALESACAASGILHLLLGHHAEDQAETQFMRRRSGSGAAGLAGIAALREARAVRVLRPLLTASRARLAATCRAAGLAVITDPSNANPATGRAQARAALSGIVPDRAEAHRLGAARAEAEARLADILAQRVQFSELGYALITPGPLPQAALGAVLRVIGGRAFAPRHAALAPLAQALRPATLGGARLLAAGRLGPGWLVVRESWPAPVPAHPGAVWDRFTLTLGGVPPGVPLGVPPGAMLGVMLGALGDAKPEPAASLPRAVRQALPALWHGATLLAVPQLGYFTPACPGPLTLAFTPPAPAAGAPFLPAPAGSDPV